MNQGHEASDTKLNASDDDRELEYDSVYSNNVRFESTVWDLKVIFGQLFYDQAGAGVDWHTAVTMPWSQAKLLSYFLRLNILFYEDSSGTIQIPRSVVPPPPTAPTDDELAKDPRLAASYESVKRLYEETFGNGET